MKINLELEVDWIDEEKGLDEEIKDSVIFRLSKKIESDFLDEAGKIMAKHAEKYIKAKTELLINTVLEKPVSISNGWNDKQEFDSIFDMVEQQMTDLYMDKIKSKGSCKEDPLLSSVKKYIDGSVAKILSDTEQKLIAYSKSEATKAVKNNELIKAIAKVVEVE